MNGLPPPPSPDGGTLLFATVLLVAAVGSLWTWRRLRGAQDFGWRELLQGMVIASLLSSAVFWVTDVLPRLTERTLDFSREADPSGARHPFIGFLEEVDRTLPEDAGVVLVNCQSGQMSDRANYILYPRRVVVRPLSMAPMGDPRRQLSALRVSEIRAAGGDWILDLDPEVWPQGAAGALIPLEDPR
jgi:hypothetical protein